ncbi:hypothetical protein ACOMHN_052416 [Nucella lapillus]
MRSFLCYYTLSATASGGSSGGSGDNLSAMPAEVLREERMRMVIHHIYGTQTHYQAAQKFLKNRTLRKMNNQGGMTLYDRIMAYRRLKEGEEPEQEGAVPADSPKQPQEPQEPHKPQQAKRRSASPTSNKGKASRDSPGQRPSSSSRSLQHLDRSDTSFASVDISDLTKLDDEKVRTPSPQPTFEDHRSYKVRHEKHPGHEKQPGHEKHPESDTAEVPPKTPQVVWTEPCAEVSEDGSQTDVCPPSPVIKRLQPAYAEVPLIVATNCRYSSFRYLLRSQSVPDMITTADTTSDNPQYSTATSSQPATAAHTNFRERMRKRRSICTSGQGLSLAQRVHWARRVEAYIASRRFQVTSCPLVCGQQFTSHEKHTAI